MLMYLHILWECISSWENCVKVVVLFTSGKILDFHRQTRCQKMGKVIFITSKEVFSMHVKTEACSAWLWHVVCYLYLDSHFILSLYSLPLVLFGNNKFIFGQKAQKKFISYWHLLFIYVAILRFPCKCVFLFGTFFHCPIENDSIQIQTITENILKMEHQKH